MEDPKNSEGLKCKFCGCPVKGGWVSWGESGKDFVAHHSCMVEEKSKLIEELECNVGWMVHAVKKSDKLVEGISKMLLILSVAEDEGKVLSEYGLSEMKRIGKEALKEFQEG